MTQPTNSRLAEVADYYHSGDYHLGLRRMIDAALETQNPAIFELTLAFCERCEKLPDGVSPEADAMSLIAAIERAGIPPPPAKPAQIVVRGISKKYNKGRFKLSPIDVTLSSGEITGLVGENGNGKTTLLRILAGELHPDTGSINYQLRTSHSDTYDLRSRLAFVQQRIPRWWGTLRENLHLTAGFHGLHGRTNELRVDMIIARLGLRPYRELSWSTISSGYRTRFELARTLLRRPEVLLLDEPLSNLDIISQQTILQDLRYLTKSHAQPLSVLLSSQQIYEVEKVSDHIIFLRQGEPIYQDTKTAARDQVQRSVYEIETAAGRDILEAALSALAVKQIQFNGGVYVVTINGQATSAQVLRAIADGGVEATYYRDISRSSRRFFAHS